MFLSKNTGIVLLIALKSVHQKGSYKDFISRLSFRELKCVYST